MGGTCIRSMRENRSMDLKEYVFLSLNSCKVMFCCCFNCLFKVSALNLFNQIKAVSAWFSALDADSGNLFVAPYSWGILLFEEGLRR